MSGDLCQQHIPTGWNREGHVSVCGKAAGHLGICSRVQCDRTYWGPYGPHYGHDVQHSCGLIDGHSGDCTWGDYTMLDAFRASREATCAPNCPHPEHLMPPGACIANAGWKVAVPEDVLRADGHIGAMCVLPTGHDGDHDGGERPICRFHCQHPEHGRVYQWHSWTDSTRISWDESLGLSMWHAGHFASAVGLGRFPRDVATLEDVAALSPRERGDLWYQQLDVKLGRSALAPLDRARVVVMSGLLHEVSQQRHTL